MGSPAGSISSSMCVSTLSPEPDIEVFECPLRIRIGYRALASQIERQDDRSPGFAARALKLKSPRTDLNQPLV